MTDVNIYDLWGFYPGGNRAFLKPWGIIRWEERYINGIFFHALSINSKQSRTKYQLHEMDKKLYLMDQSDIRLLIGYQVFTGFYRPSYF